MLRFLCVFTILFLLSFPLLADAISLNGKYTVYYVVLDESGDLVTDQQPTLKILRSDGLFYDFLEDSFSSDPQQSESTLAYDSNLGAYTYDFTNPDGSDSQYVYYFIVQNSDENYKDYQVESVYFQSVAKPSDVTVYVGE